MSQTSKLHLVLRELRVHFPATLMGSLSAIAVLGLVQFFCVHLGHWNRTTTFHDFFFSFHLGHVFFSAIVSAAIFYRHEKKLFKTITVGYLSPLIFCTISDILFPYFGGVLLQAPMHLHICLFEEPIIVLVANTLGIAVGVLAEMRKKKITFLSHGVHIFISSFASLFYLVTFGVTDWFPHITGILVITIIAVIIPCCSSDIVIPVSFASGIHGHEHEDEHTRT